jgi:hypothetical protein
MTTIYNGSSHNPKYGNKSYDPNPNPNPNPNIIIDQSGSMNNIDLIDPIDPISIGNFNPKKPKKPMKTTPLVPPVSPSQLPLDRAFPWKQGVRNCLAFCYPRNAKAFIVKGDFNLVTTYLKNLNYPIVAYFKVYTDSLTVIEPTKFGIIYGLNSAYRTFIHQNTRRNPQTLQTERHHRNYICIKHANDYLMCKVVRQAPRKWIKELDEYIDPNGSKTAPSPANFKAKLNHLNNPNLATWAKVVKAAVVPAPKELTVEEIEAKAAAGKSLNTMQAALKQVGAIPDDGNEMLDIFELQVAADECITTPEST